MSRTKTRRKTALGRLLAAGLVLVLVWLCLGISLTPGQTIRRAERLCGLEETYLLRQETVGGVTLSVSENPDAFLVTAHRLDWHLGWWNDGVPLLLLNRGEGDPRCQAGALALFDREAETSTVFLFGWTDLPNAVSAATQRPADTASRYADLTAPVQKDGYFWAQAVFPSSAAQPLQYPMQLQLLDQAGEVLLTCDLSDCWATQTIRSP